MPDESLGPSGRTVRCAACGESWRAHADVPLELTNSADEGAIGRPAEGLAEDPPLTAPELPRAFRARAEQKRRFRQAAVAGAVWGVIGAGFLALIAGAYFFRVDVVKLYPRAAGAYAAAGVPVNPTGLEFENVKAAAAPDGAPAVTVSGVVRNVQDEAAPTPPVRVSLVDDKGQRIASKLVTLTAASLAPGQTESFAVVLPDPQARAADVGVDFALDVPRAAPRPEAPAPLRKAAPAPAAAVAAPASTGLRPAIDVAPAAEAQALPAEDPLALDIDYSAPVSAAGHG